MVGKWCNILNWRISCRHTIERTRERDLLLPAFSHKHKQLKAKAHKNLFSSCRKWGETREEGGHLLFSPSLFPPPRSNGDGSGMRGRG